MDLSLTQESLRAIRLPHGLHKGRVPGPDPDGQFRCLERGLAPARLVEGLDGHRRAARARDEEAAAPERLGHKEVHRRHALVHADAAALLRALPDHDVHDGM